jgi:hypothetical protein
VRQQSISISDYMMCGKTEHMLHDPKRFLPRTFDTTLSQHLSRFGDHLTECRLTCRLRDRGNGIHH